MKTTSAVLHVLLLAGVLIPAVGHSQTDAAGMRPAGVSQSQQALAAHDDTQASQVISEYRKLIAPQRWEGLHGRGFMTYGHDPAAPSYPAELTLGADGEFRLDVQGPQGLSSVRTNRALGGSMDGAGIQHSLSHYVVASGVLPITRILASGFAAHHFTATVDITPDARADSSVLVSLSFPLLGYSTAVPEHNDGFPCDFYFGPDRLLRKSVAPTSRLGSNRVTGYSVVTYGDYKEIDGTRFPMDFSETIGGQLLWHLKLTDIEPHLAVSPDFFTFERDR